MSATEPSFPHAIVTAADTPTPSADRAVTARPFVTIGGQPVWPVGRPATPKQGPHPAGAPVTVERITIFVRPGRQSGRSRLQDLSIEKRWGLFLAALMLLAVGVLLCVILGKRNALR
jgi:hypothetical protein